MFGKADPYARLIIGVQEFSTRPNPAGGKNPIWNEEFVFDISNERYVWRGVVHEKYVGQDCGLRMWNVKINTEYIG